MVNLALAAALAAATPQPIAAEAAERAEPAMFVVRDADTIVYIFGTFHALDGKADWFRDEVRSAFDGSGELILETLVPDTPAVAVAAPPAPSGAPQPQFHPIPMTPSASFLGTTRAAIDAGKAQGMSVGNGADMVLRRAAELSGKPVEGLETLESQLTMFTRLPPAPAASSPRAGASVPNPVDSLSKAMVEMQAAWKQGDQSVFVRMLGQLKAASPEAYRMMFTERNGRWADWIGARMQTPGTVFVAVGAGHLAGSDSLLVRLAQRGIESTRTN